MKTELIISTLFLFNLSTLEAAGLPIEGQFATLKPHGNCDVIQPTDGKSHNSIYFSKDCSTAYVLPSLNMKKFIFTPYMTADTGICQRLAQVQESLKGIDAKVVALDDLISKTQVKIESNDDPAKKAFLEEKVVFFKNQKNTILKEKTTMLDPFYDTRALRTQIRVESDIMDEVAAYQQANLKPGSDASKIYPTRFSPAIIDDSILEISLQDKKGIQGRTVLNVDFPGVAYFRSENEEKNLFNKNATLLEMNGSMSGIVDLSAVTFCSALTDPSKLVPNDVKALTSIFESAVALNLQYKVRVQSGIKVSLNSSISTHDFLNKFSDKITKTVYSRSEILGTLIEGDVINSLDIQLDDKGSSVELGKLLTTEDEKNVSEANVVAPLISKFIKTYLDQVEAKLENLGLINVISDARAKEIAATTTTEVGSVTTICSTKSSWFGFSKSTSCHATPIFVQVNHDGVSNLIRSNTDSSTIENHMNLETNQTTYIRHSSTFGKKQ